MKNLSVYDFTDFLNWGVMNKKFFRLNTKGKHYIYTSEKCYDYNEDTVIISWKDFLPHLVVYVENITSKKISKRIKALSDKKEQYLYALATLEKIKNNKSRATKHKKYGRVVCQKSYEVGDTVLVVSLDVVRQAQNAQGTENPSFGADSFVHSMEQFCGQQVVITALQVSGKYSIEGSTCNWTNEMFVGKVNVR